MQILSGSLNSFMGRVRVVELRWVDEARGQLIEIDHASLPFLPRRTFIVTNVPAGTSRGGHSHRECEQLFVCLQGSLTIDVAFGDERVEILLDVPRLALYVAPGIWTRQRYNDFRSQLLVCASLPFDADLYFPEPEAK